MSFVRICLVALVMLLCANSYSQENELVASTYFGSDGAEVVTSMAVDQDGFVYLTGFITANANMPIAGNPLQGTYNGGTGDAIVAKFSPDLSTLVASSFLGGSSHDRANAIKITPEGHVAIVGQTNSPDFPTTSGAYDETLNDNSAYRDGFIIILTNDLSAVVASTLLGAGAEDEINDLAIDAAGNIYVTGSTRNSLFPVTPGAFSTDFVAIYDAFVAKLSGDLTTLIAATFLGGISHDFGVNIDVDTNGDVVTSGYTRSADFPVSANAYDNEISINFDLYATRLSNDLTQMIGSTFVGGDYDDRIYGGTIGRNGQTFLVGSTDSDDFPTTSGAYDTAFRNGWRGYVSCLNYDMSALTASTFLGGVIFGGCYINDVVIDGEGNVIVAGGIVQSDFPASTNAFDRTLNGLGDGFAACFTPSLDELAYATYFGGDNEEECKGIALDAGQHCIIAGQTNSTDLPIAGTPHDDTFNGSAWDIFISKFSPIVPAPRNALPLEWLSFSVVQQGKSAQLTWRTVQERDNERFEVEKSRDGQNWGQIGRVAARNSLLEGEYGYADSDPFPGTNFYRIKQIDLSGESTFSPIRALDWAASSVLSFYPSPAHDLVSLSGSSEVSQLRIYSAAGKLVGDLPVINNKVNVSSLSPGVYFLIAEGYAASKLVKR